MTNRWLKGVAIVALMAVGTVAQAADLPTRKEAPAPVFVPPPFTWTGFYVGVNAGGIWGSGGNASTTFAGTGAFGIPFTILTHDWPNNNGFGSGNGGFIGGGQAGYNWQTGSFVLGVETDFDGSTVSRSRSVVGPTFADPLHLLGTDFFTAHGSASLDWLGSTRGRVGWVVTPDSRLMIYGTGGVAYGGASGNLSIFDATNGWFWSSGNRSNTRTGWAAGGGVEYAFTNNIILGAEYLYYDLGSRDFAIAPSPAATAFFGTPVFSQTKINFNASVIRARLSYKF
jgi:outer membrane immunogenic protein